MPTDSFDKNKVLLRAHGNAKSALFVSLSSIMNGTLMITNGVAKPPHAHGSPWLISSSLWLIMAGVGLIGSTALLLYQEIGRPPRIELSPAGIAMIGSYGRRQFWSWSALGPFRRGPRPFSIEAPRTDDPSARVYLPEWTLAGDDRLVTVLNNYRAGLK